MISIDVQQDVCIVTYQVPDARHNLYARTALELHTAVTQAVTETRAALGAEPVDLIRAHQLGERERFLDSMDYDAMIAADARDDDAAIFPAAGTPGTPRPVSLSPRADPDRFSQGQHAPSPSPQVTPFENGSGPPPTGVSER
jgi:hypothetical protein